MEILKCLFSGIVGSIFSSETKNYNFFIVIAYDISKYSRGSYKLSYKFYPFIKTYEKETERLTNFWLREKRKKEVYLNSFIQITNCLAGQVLPGG